MAMEPRRVIRDAHDQSILCVAYNLHRRELITGSQDSFIKVWEHDTGKHIRTLNDGHLGWVTGLAYGSAQRMLFSVSVDGQLIVWDTRNKCDWFQRVKTDGQAHCVEWDNRRQLVYVGGVQVVRVYSVIKKNAEEPSRRKDRPILKLLETIKDVHPGGFVRSIVTTDTGRIFSAGSDASLAIYDIYDANGAKQPSFSVRKLPNCHNGAISTAAFDWDNGLMITGSFDKTVKVWSQEGKMLQTFGPLADTVTGVCYVPKTKMVWMSANSTQPVVYDPRTGNNVTVYKQPPTVRNVVRATRADGVPTTNLSAASGGVDDEDELAEAIGADKPSERLLRLFSIRGTDEVVGATSSRALIIWRYNPHGAMSALTGHTDWVEVVCYAKKMELDASLEPVVQLYSGGSDSVVRIWEPQSRLNAHLYRQVGTSSGQHKGAILCACWCEAYNAFITGSDDCTIRVWFQQTTAAAVATVRADHIRRASMLQTAHSPDDSGAPAPEADAGSAADGVQGQGSPGNAPAGAPVTASASAMSGSAMGAPGAAPDASSVRQERTSSFVSDGTAGAATAGSAAEPASREELEAAEAAAQYVEATCSVLGGHEERITGVVVLQPPAPPGRIVSVSWDLSIRWWKVQPAEHEEHLLYTIENAHDDYIHGIAYSPMTHQIATCSADQGVKIWEASKRTLSATLSGHTADVSHVAWNEVYGVWVTGSDDHTIRVWGTDGSQLQQIDTQDAVAALSTDLNFGYALVAFNDTSYGLRVYYLGLDPPGDEEEEGAAAAPAAAAEAHAPAAAAEGPPSTREAYVVESHYGHTDCVRAVVHIPEKGQYITASWDTTMRTWRETQGRRYHGTGALRPPRRLLDQAPRGESREGSAMGASGKGTAKRAARAKDAHEEEVVMAYADRHPLQVPKALQKEVNSQGMHIDRGGDRHSAARRRTHRRSEDLFDAAAGSTGYALRLQDLLTEKKDSMDRELRTLEVDKRTSIARSTARGHHEGSKRTGLASSTRPKR